MDEYTADPYETEKEAQRVLRKMRIDNAKAEVGQMAEESRARKADENTYKRLGQPVNRGGGGAGGTLDLEGKMGSSRLKKPSYKAGGKVSASKRADGCAIKGKTKGRIV
jgi:hypothetical protein